MGVFTPAMNSNLPDTPDLHDLSGQGGPHLVGRVQSVTGQLLPAGDADGPKYGCANSPDYRKIAFGFADALLAAGADAIQHDAPKMNGVVPEWGHPLGNLSTSGCYCSHCVAKFGALLMATLPATERAQYGIKNASWSYRDWLLARDIPDADSMSDSSALRGLFVRMQQDSGGEYVDALLDHVRASADKSGKNVTVSSNNGGEWGPPYDKFDYGMGELAYQFATPAGLYQRLVSSVPTGKYQVRELLLAFCSSKAHCMCVY